MEKLLRFGPAQSPRRHPPIGRKPGGPGARTLALQHFALSWRRSVHDFHVPCLEDVVAHRDDYAGVLRLHLRMPRQVSVRRRPLALLAHPRLLS